MLINVTIQTFMSENELELSDKRWTDVKDEYLPTLYKLGLERYTTTRIWNKSEKHQLGHIFEYRDKDAMEAYWLAAKKGKIGEIYNICGNQKISVNH